MARLEGNVYVDPSYTAAITGTTHEITGEVLEFGVNAFASGGTTSNIPAVGGTIFYKDWDNNGASVYNDGTYDVYAVNLKSNYLYAVPKKNDQTYTRDIKVYHEGGQIKHLTLLGRGTNVTLVGSISFTAKNVSFTDANDTMGGGDGGNDVHNLILGDISFNISDSTSTNSFYIQCGSIGNAETQCKVNGVISNVKWGGAFRGVRATTGESVYADFNIAVTGSSFSSNIEFGYPQTDIVWQGNAVMTVTATTASNIYAFERATSLAGEHSFTLNVAAAEAATQTGTIGNFNIINIASGATLTATTINDAAELNIALGSKVTTGAVSNVERIVVVGELTQADTVVISGLGESGIGDALVYVGDVEYTTGKFPGFYEIVGGDLVIHSASSTVLLVNPNYTDGQTTSLGPKGYSTFEAAQAKVTDKATSSIMVYSGDEEVEMGEFTSDIVTKDYSTSFVGTGEYAISLNSQNIIVGDTAAEVESANVSATYTNTINSVKFGNVTGTATVSIDHAGDSEDTRIGSIDLTGAVIADAQVTVSDSVIGDVKLADQAETAGKITVKNSTIANVYGGAGNVQADLTGANQITNVYAEGQGSKIKLAGSNVETYFAGLSESGASIETLTYNDAVTAQNIIIGGNANTIGKIDATITGGAADTLKIGGEGDTVTGDVDLTLAGGKFSNVVIGEGATLNGAIDVNLAGGTVDVINSTFYGLIYGASVTGALDGGSQGTSRTLNVLGHAKVDSVRNFDSLNVTGGTLNVASGDRKSSLSDGNSIEISGDILNERTINAGKISAANINNYGAIGTIRDVTNFDAVGIELTGNLKNYDVILTSGMNIGGDFVNTGKITAVGNITVTGSANNSGDLYFYATSTPEGTFIQNGGLVLNGVDFVNTGFVSAGKLQGVANLTTSNLYVTGGAEITGNITIDAGAEVAFTNKADSSATALTLGGSISMSDTSKLVVSDVLTTSGTKTITVNVGDLIGVNEIVRTGGKEGEPGGLNDWTIKLEGASKGNYELVRTDSSIVIYSTDQLFVNSAFSEDGKIVVEGNTLAFGKNAFASVADAVAAAKAGAKIIIVGDKSGMDVDAAGFDVVIDNSVVGDVTAKSIAITSDTTIKNIVSAASLTIDAGALLTVSGTISDATAITIDASEGTGSRLVLDVDPEKVTLDASKVTIIGKDTYKALVLAAPAEEGATVPVHAGDLYITSSDYSYYIPASFTAITEKQTVPDLDKDGKEQYDAETGELITKEVDVIVGYTAKFVDGDTFDAATGDALFADLNAFGGRAEAVASAKAANGVFVIVDNLVNNAVGEDGVATMFEVDYNKGGSDQTRAIVGVLDDGNTQYVSDQDHTTIVSGTTNRGNIYGLSRWFDMSGDYTFVADNVRQTNSDLYVMGNNIGSVMNGNVDATITNSYFNNLNLVYGSVGTTDFDPVDINLVMRDTRVAEFRGLRARDTTTATKINANLNISVYDSMVNGAFYGIYTADWVADNANIYQASYVSGKINVEVGGTTVSNQFRPGDSLPHGANALQTFNVPTTLHVVATEKSAVTRADWVMEWDTIIIDADATLRVNNGLEFTTAYKAPNSPQDNGGQLIQIYVNMSGYSGGTRTVIDTGFINTDATMSNISVIGDNDLTGQRMLVYGQNTAQEGGYYHLNRVAVFDKADDMYVNTAYSEATSGTTDSSGQDLYYNANAHSSFEGALSFATEWGGTIIVTGGTFASQDFNGNNLELRGGMVEAITMGDRKASTLKVDANGTFGAADGSGKSTMEIAETAKVGDVQNFANVNIAKKAGTSEFGAIAGSNLAFFADAEIKADSLNLSDASVVIDVDSFVGGPHVVLTTTNGISGFNASNVSFVGKDADKYGVTLNNEDKELVLTTTIQSDTFANSTYTEATTGTILPDGTYLQYGFNAFNTLAGARAALGSVKNTMTVTGGTFSEDLHLVGANFAMEGGVLDGIIYGCEDDDLTGMNITIDAGSVGGIDLTAGDGAYSVSKAVIDIADGVSVTGSIVGAGDTMLNVDGNVVTGGIENVKQLTVTTDTFLTADYIELDGGTIYVTGSASSGSGKVGNLTKLVTTQSGIKGASFAGDPGFSVYSNGNDVFLLDLTRIYVDPTYTEAVTGTTASTGDTLSWGVNAFNDLNASYSAVIGGSTLFISNWGTPGTQAGDIRPTVPTSFVVQGPTNFSVCFNNGQPATFDRDITVVITNTSTPQGNTAIFNGASGNKNVFNGNVYVTFNGTDRLNTNTSFRISKNSVFNGDLFQINIDGSNGLGIRDDYWLIGDVAASDFQNLGKLEFNITGMTTSDAAKWTGIFDGDPNLPAMFVELNIKDSLYRAGNNDWSVGLVSTGSNSSNVKFDVHLEGSTIMGWISGARASKWNGQPGSVYAGTRTLYVDGTKASIVQDSMMFHHIIIDANTSLTVRGQAQFNPANSSGPNTVEIDVSGYTGGDKMVLSCGNFQGADFEFRLNGNTNGTYIAGLNRSRGAYIITKNGDVLFNLAYDSADLNGTAVGNTFIHIDEETPENTNAFNDFELAKAAFDTHEAANPGRTFYVTGNGEEEVFNADGYAVTITAGVYPTLNGTDDGAASVASVDMTITGGTFTNVNVAEDGKSVTGDARIEIAGGTFGTPDIYETPEVGEGEEPAEPQLVEEGVHAVINGSKGSVGGTSTLTVSANKTIYGEIKDFDVVNVDANLTVTGDFSAGNVTLDASKLLTVNGALDVTGIHLASAEYTGPSKIVMTAEGLSTLDLSKVITVDGKDRYYFDAAKNNLWLVSDDPGNIYVDASYTSAIDGTQIGNDLLIYGVNAFSDFSEAIARTTSDYTLYVYDGVFAGDYDLTGVGQVRMEISGGTFGSLKIGDGADSDHRSTVRITASTSAVSIGSIVGIEGSTLGYRVIANKDAAIGTMDGIQYFRFGAGQNVSVNGISYVEIAGATEGLYTAGELVIDFAGYTAGAGVLLQTTDGIANYLVPNEFIEGTTIAVSREVVGAQNNNAMLMPYYDETKKAIVAVERGAIATLDANSSTAQNGTIVGTGESATTQVYGYNLSNWNVNAGRYAITGGTLFADGGEQTAFYWFFTAAPINVNVKNLRTGGFVAGYNDDSAADQKFRDGDFTAVIDATTITWFACIAGQGNQDAHQEMVVGNWNEDTQSYDDTVWNVTITNGTHDTNDFRVARYANLSGGTVNVTIADYDLRGDLALFNRVFNGKTEGVDSQLKEVNVTLSNIQAPASKWLRVWGHQEDNATKLNLTITDSNFVGDTFAIGLFDNDLAGNWSGEADVYVSGMTMTQGRFGGGRGRTDGGLDNIQGTRRLHIVGGTNNIMLTREFNSIEIADGAMLTGNDINMSEGEGFILIGETGYTGDVKQYAVVGNTITGVAQDNAKFVDAEGNEISGYKAVVGSKSVFIYKTAGDVFYSNEYSTLTTGTSITDSDGKTNYLVYGDNAVVSMKDAYASVDARGGSEYSTIQIVNALATNIFTNGYKTVVNNGAITNVYGGGQWTTQQVDSGEVDEETGAPIMKDEIVPAASVASADITVKKGTGVVNVIVATENSQVTGDALITIAADASVTGTLDGGIDYVGGVSNLVFEGAGSAKAITGFDNVTIKANDVVNLSGAFSGTTITIDATGFTDFTKKVLVAEGGFGDDPTTNITVNIINGTGFGSQFLDDGKTLVVTSELVGNTFANADWTEADVHNKFVGDMALVWDTNAFDSFAKAASKIGEGSTLYIEGGTSTDDIVLSKNNDVIVSANTTGTALGSITADGGSLTIDTDFAATDIAGFSAIKFNAADDITISGGIELTEGGTITIDMTGYTQAEVDAPILTVAGGITNLENENINLVGEGSGVFHAYYSGVDNSIHAMRVDNFYVDVNFGTAGEGIVDGQKNPITGEALIWNVNAFYYLNDALGKMAPGQNLYINDRQGNNIATRDQMANIYLSNSNVPVFVNGYTSGDKVYTGDLWVTIDQSTIATGGDSYLFGTVTAGEPWNHTDYIIGNVTLNVTGSTIGGDTNRYLYGFHFQRVVGTEEAPATITMNFTDTVIRDDVWFIGDSPIGKVETIDGQTYTGAEVVNINLDNVSVPQNKWWIIMDGDQESKGTVNVNIKDSTFGTGGMRFTMGDWQWGQPRDATNFIFTVENSTFNGYLTGGAVRWDHDGVAALDSELVNYTGDKTVNLIGDNYIQDLYWFKEVNLAAGATLTGQTLRMASAGGKVNIDVTGYTGNSKVIIGMDNAFENITLDDIKITGLDPEDPSYTIVTDYDETAETPTLSKVVIKGAIKDIYVNPDYSLETVTLGTSYNGDLLFFGENAFSDLPTAVAALTEGAVLYVTGGKITTSEAAFTNSITIDATAQLTYKGAEEGAAPITINGDLVNAGTFLISAKGFVDAESTVNNVKVLTATSITGEGFKTDNSAYNIKVVDNEVYLELKKVDVYVNTAWADIVPGDEPVVVDVPGGTAILGVDAFATADAAAKAVSANGSITVLASDVTFGSAITTKVIATEGSVIEGAAVATNNKAGSLTLQSGASATNANVRAAGTLTVEAGASVNGKLGMASGATVVFVEGSFLNLDISAIDAGTPLTGFSNLSGAPTYSLTIAADQADGTYTLATDAASFNSNITLKTVGGVIGELEFGKTVQFNGIDYTLALNEANELTFKQAVYVAPITVTYVSSDWTSAKDGDVVTVSGGTAIFGYDAFTTGDAAIAAVVDYGEVKVLKGDVSFTGAINKTISLTADATLTGKAAFTKPATINGTVAFDTALTAESAQISGFNYITGDASYTLTAAAVAGTYVLASDVTAFTSGVKFGDVTLTVDGEAAIVGDFTYALSLTDGNLALTVAAYIPPAPETPTQAFVNSAWSTLAPGAIVPVGSTSATIGYDAFAALDAAIAGTTDDAKINVVGGEITFGAYSKTITVDAAATVVGKNVFDKAITVNGEFAFDTAFATADAAQITGLSFVAGTATYSLNVATPAVGTYLLASDVAGFNKSVQFGSYTLAVGAEALTIGDFTYALAITDNNDLALLIAEKPVPPTPEVLTQAYANSEWAGQTAGTVIDGVTIGYNGFATLGEAEAAVTDDGKVNVTGGEITFGAYSKTITVDAAAKVVGKNVFDKAITINGTVAFDTAVATAESAQISGFSFVSGTASYTLTDAAPAVGTYLLASDAASFNSTVQFGTNTLTVGAEATVVGNFTYALSLTDGTLALTVAEFVPPVPTVDYVYVNSAWSDKQAGDIVDVNGTTATIGTDAFASGDIAIASVTVDGTVEVVGGEVNFTNPIGKTVVIDATAVLVGKNAFEKAITINGSVVFDTTFATETAAQFDGFSFVTGSASYSLNAAAAAGTWLLASDAESFNSSVQFGGTTLTVGAEATQIGDFKYALSITEGKALALTVTAVEPGPGPEPTPLTQAYANSEWAGQTPGTVIGGATIGYDGFVTLGEAEAAVTADGKVNVVGGEITFGAYSKTITVDAAAKVVGKNVFDKAITINGTVAFDTAFATAETAQISGFSFVSGTATYTLTDAAPAVGTYLLASEVTAFTSGVQFGDVTLTVGAEATVVGDYTYALTLDDGKLALTIAEKPVPPTPTKPEQGYVNSDWAGVTPGTVIGGATIGYDGFATLGEAEAAVTDDGKVNVVGGEITFGAYSKTITVDADAKVVGKNVFDKAITINGTVAFDTQYATATEAQVTGLSFVSGDATYTLTGATTKGTYLLATDAAGFDSEVLYGDVVLTVGAEPITIGELNYTLEVTGAGELALSVSELVNGPDDGWNNYVYNKKATPALNPDLDDFVVNTLVKGVEEIFIDEKYSVSIDDKHNFVNGAKATVADTADYAKIVLDKAARLVFKADATAATKLSIYSLVESKGKLSMKKKQSTALKKDKTTGTYSISTKPLLLEAGTYYIAADCTDKKALEDLYNVYLDNGASTFFADGDDGWNNYVYDKKATPAKNPNIDMFVENKLVKNGTNDIIIEGTGTTALQLDEDVTSVSGWNNFVGFGDAADYAVITLEHATSLKLDANALDASKLVIYSFDGVSKMKALQTTTLKKAKGATEFTATSKNLLLQAGTYFISMQSTNAKKGGGAYYNVQLNSGTTVYDDGDNGWNNYVYDKKATPQKNPNIDEFVMNEITSATTDVYLDNESTSMEDWSNFVGFGDTADYAKIYVAGNSAKLSFSVTATDAAKFIIYSFDGVSKMKALQTSTLKKLGEKSYYIDTKALALAEGEYFISVQSTNAKKGGAAWYNVAVNQTKSSGLLDVSAAVSMQNDLQFAGQDVDTFADVAAYNADSQLIDDKQSWQSIAALA